MSATRIVITTLVAGSLIATPLPSFAQTMQALPASTAAVQASSAGVSYDLNRSACPGGCQPVDWDLSFDPGWSGDTVWTWQLLPNGLMYRSYLTGPKEPRFGSAWVHERNDPFWDIALGGRAGILRYGTEDPVWPQGYQLDIEGAAFPRLTLDHYRDLMAVDFRFGIPLTYRRGPWETKFGYYHLSSHLGDEYMLKHPEIERINYARDSLLFGVAYRPIPDVRLYAETGWAFYTAGGAEPWEFQFGFEYSPAQPASFRGAPFFAVGTHLREEVNFGGNLVVQTGWEWRGPNGQLFRWGLHYLNGKSNQYQFHDEHEEQIGVGTWFDF